MWALCTALVQIRTGYFLLKSVVGSLVHSLLQTVITPGFRVIANSVLNNLLHPGRDLGELGGQHRPRLWGDPHPPGHRGIQAFGACGRY